MSVDATFVDRVIRDVNVLLTMKRWTAVDPFLEAAIEPEDTETRDAVLIALFPHVLPKDDREKQVVHEAYKNQVSEK